MKRLAVALVTALALAGCGSTGTSTGATAGTVAVVSGVSRDQCESTYGVGNCVVRHGSYVPLGIPLGQATTTTDPLATCSYFANVSTSASAAYYAKHQQWPFLFTQMTEDNPPELVTDHLDTSHDLSGDGWQLWINGDGTAQPTFNCSSAP